MGSQPVGNYPVVEILGFLGGELHSTHPLNNNTVLFLLKKCQNFPTNGEDFLLCSTPVFAAEF